MKIAGLASLRRTGTFSMRDAAGNKVALLITALPLGFIMDLMQRLPAPPVPQKAMGKNRDGTTLFVADKEDPTFRAAESEVNRLQLAMLVATVLRDEPRVVFDAKREQYTNEPEFWRAVLKELVEFGFTDADFGRLRAAAEALTISQASIDEAKQVFSEAETPALSSG